jgi:vitamin B12 transporter
MRFVFLVVIVFAFNIVFSQIIVENDSISNFPVQNLKALDITTFRINKESLFDNTFRYDSIKLANLPTLSINQLLSQQSPVFIKQYGAGGLSTPALRGASAAQTAILWNGFNLQSSMNGVFDLSLLPLFFIDEFAIDYGASSTLWGSGAVGGAIQMNNINNYNNGFTVNAGYYQGSFGANTQQIGFSISKKKWLNKTRIFRSEVENNFPFINHTLSEKPVQFQQNAAVFQFGILQENSFKIAKYHELELKIWYQNNERGVPPTMHNSFGTAIQEDKALRNILAWKFEKNKIKSVLRTAYFDEDINYIDTFAQINSPGNTKSLINEYEFTYQFNNKNQINIGVNNSNFSAISSSYEGIPNQTRNAVFINHNLQSENKKWGLSSSFRQEIIDNHWIKPIPKIVSYYRFREFVKLNISGGLSYRFPTFNDLYWFPGGNPNLKPENGWNIDSDLQIDFKKMLNIKDSWLNKATFSITGFYREVDDWILWQPSIYGFWESQNIKKVNSKGIETSTNLLKNWKDISIGIDLQTSYILSTDETENSNTKGLQLFYTPIYSASGNFFVAYKSLNINLNSNYIGYVYTNADHSQYLEPYQLLNCQVNYKIPYQRHQIKVHFAINNLLNKDYQVIAWRAMPGRNYLVGLNFEFNQKFKS